MLGILIPIPILILVLILILILVLLSVVYYYLQSKRALRGDFGRKQMWAAELMEECGEFADAVKNLEEEELSILASVSLKKQELRENVLDYRQKKNDNQNS
jgi:predicted Holliday junction resolvase-like endonuclease